MNISQKTFQINHQGPHAGPTKGPHAANWYVVDATDLIVGRLASVLAKVITGKHKPTYTPHSDTGDFVVVLNADKIRFTGNKWSQKKYYKHTGYIGGLKTQTATELLERHPEEILKKAVWGMTGKTPLAKRQLSKLKIYTGAEHPHAAQNPEALPYAAVRKTSLESLGQKKAV